MLLIKILNSMQNKKQLNKQQIDKLSLHIPKKNCDGSASHLLKPKKSGRQYKQRNVSINQPTAKFYRESDGFIFQRSILQIGVECVCLYSAQDKQGSIFHNEDKENKIDAGHKTINISLHDNQIVVMRNWVKHTFDIPYQQNQYVKVIIGKDYKLDNVFVGNKKIHIFDQILETKTNPTILKPLELIQKAALLRCLKIGKSAQNIKLNWEKNVQPPIVTPRRKNTAENILTCNQNNRNLQKNNSQTKLGQCNYFSSRRVPAQNQYKKQIIKKHSINLTNLREESKIETAPKQNNNSSIKQKLKKAQEKRDNSQVHQNGTRDRIDTSTHQKSKKVNQLKILHVKTNLIDKHKL